MCQSTSSPQTARPPNPCPLGAYLVSGTQLFHLAAMYLWASYKVFLRLRFLLLIWSLQAHLCYWVDLRERMKYRTQWPGSVPSPLLSWVLPLSAEPRPALLYVKQPASSWSFSVCLRLCVKVVLMEEIPAGYWAWGCSSICWGNGESGKPVAGYLHGLVSKETKPPRSTACPQPHGTFPDSAPGWGQSSREGHSCNSEPRGQLKELAEEQQRTLLKTNPEIQTLPSFLSPSGTGVISNTK